MITCHCVTKDTILTFKKFTVFMGGGGERIILVVMIHKRLLSVNENSDISIIYKCVCVSVRKKI